LVSLILCVSFLVISLGVYKITLSYFPTGVKSWIKSQASAYGYQFFHRKASLIKALLVAPKHLSTRSNLPYIHIDMKFKHLEKLRAKREEALKRGVLVTSADDFVPAQIRIGDRNIKVKLRLKGDWTDHLEGYKWSSRVHVKGKDQLFGMRRFSIQHPKTRGYQSEILFFETLKRYGVLTPRYFFVRVSFNGDDVGIMALEEHFSKELLEHNGRKEGVIVKFDESLVWAATDGVNRGFGGIYDNVYNAHIDSFRSGKVMASPTLKRNYAVAVGLLRSFLSGDLKTSEVFDVQQMGGFVAVAEFYRTLHAVRWHNLRFYLNPITMKLEPIGFDGDIHQPTGSWHALHHKEPILAKMMQDKKFEQAYQHVLEQIVNDYEAGELVAFLKDIEVERLAQLRKEFYFLDNFNYSRLADHINLLLQGFKPSESHYEKYPQHIFAYIIGLGHSPYLELSNALPADIEVVSIVWKDSSGNSFPFKTKQSLTFPIRLEAQQPENTGNSLAIPFINTTAEQKLKMEIATRIKGTKTFRRQIATQYYPLLERPVLPSVDIDEVLNRNPFLYLQAANIIAVRPGDWAVEDRIIVPEGYSFFIPGGVVLRFGITGSLVSYGDLQFEGSQSKPIVLTGQNSTASDKEGTWQGLVVFNASKRSILSYTSISNTSGINRNEWQLTGGTTFYKSDVNLINCTLTGTTGEDTLNIIHSDFKLNNVMIKNCASDAFDSDFSTGEILSSIFQDIGLAGGGDGVDFSGSNVVMKNSQFLKINDKAISVGERSVLQAEKINIVDAGSAVVSKDASEVTLKDISIKGSRLASLMTYMKKPEYGPSKLVAQNVMIEGGQRQTLAQEDTELVLNGKKVKTEKVDVDNLYKTVMKSGLK